MHTSVSLGLPCEFIDITPLNPLISKCKIKVCYVGEDPNRNGSVITKETAKQLANSLPGSPIVGYYNEEEGDFDEHSRELVIKDGKIQFKDITRPYGFVDLGAKCYFEFYQDDDELIREYLVTEGYLWTGQYEEARRIMEHGNNQSMELDENLLNAKWTKSINGKSKLFIISEGVISKLCILGENKEPCFEGASITPIQFSFAPEFKESMDSMMALIKETLDNKGGTQVFTTYAVTVGDSLWNNLFSHVSEKFDIDGVFVEGEQKFAVLKDKETSEYKRLNFSFEEEQFVAEESYLDIESYTPSEAPQFSLEEVLAYKAKKEEEKEKEEDKDENDESEDDKTEDNSEDEDKKKKTKYSLDDIPEYNELLVKFNNLQEEFNSLKESTDSELSTLRQFKLEVERKEKENLINSFTLLSDEDKKEVRNNIDNYSLHDIEAELSIICVRNRVDFSLFDKAEKPDSKITTFNLNGTNIENPQDTPDWVKAVMEVAKEM